MVWFIGFSSFAGASMPIAMFSDMLSTLTIHIYSFYLASGRIYHWQLTILQSLFHLFRGKKHNVLRNRIDSCDYDLDQLLVGTILFTLLFFLLPTVAVFYLNFAIARMAIISLKAGFDTLLSCLNHFPLFALMLRIKDPRRLPGGIRFELRDTHDYRRDGTSNNTEGPPPTSVIYLKVGQIYSQNYMAAILTWPLVDSFDISNHVQSVLPDGKPHPKTLPLAQSLLLPPHRQVCATYQPQEFV
jgi:phosphatidylinositol glycan class Q protein